MQPPVPAASRDTSGLRVDDAELLAVDSSLSLPLVSTLSELKVPLNARRSAREGRPVPLERALDVVAPLMTATSEWIAADDYVERQTFVPSAGGRHPLTVLALTKEEGDPHHTAWAVSASATPRRYPLTTHDIQVGEILQAVADALRSPHAPSTVIVALVRFRRTLSKYPDGESLVWRDTGVFLGAAHLVATGLGLRSCIVGTAETTSFALRGTADTLIDVGALALWQEERTP